VVDSRAPMPVDPTPPNPDNPLSCAQSKGSGGAAPRDTLQNLQVFLTLQKAEAKGFSPEKYSLTSDQAADLAVIFTKYDVNDDMVLEPSEVRKLL
jgi:hypothetical protein